MGTSFLLLAIMGMGASFLLLAIMSINLFEEIYPNINPSSFFTAVIGLTIPCSMFLMLIALMI